MQKKLLHGLVMLAVVCPIMSSAECIGDGDYRVCSESSVDESGNGYIRSWDTEGNEYRVDTESHSYGDNGIESTSSDSDGNSYSIKSWVDSNGDAHTTDSEGNECIITHTGVEIGCD